jgi:hypothetical protein
MILLLTASVLRDRISPVDSLVEYYTGHFDPGLFNFFDVDKAPIFLYIHPANYPINLYSRPTHPAMTSF